MSFTISLVQKRETSTHKHTHKMTWCVCVCACVCACALPVDDNGWTSVGGILDMKRYTR